MFTVNKRKLNNNLLVFGYIRLHYKSYICYAIKYLCQNFYNTVANLQINMQKFKECNEEFKKVFITAKPQFTILGNGLMFYIARDDQFQDEFDLQVLFAPSAISAKFKQITLYFEVYCDALDLHRIGCLKINPNEQKNHGGEYIITIPEKAVNSVIEYEYLNLQFYTEIIGLQHQQDILHAYNFDHRSLQSVINFNWDIDSKVYNRISEWKGSNTKYYSPTFGSINTIYPSYSFCLGIIPSLSELTLECLVLPKDVESIRCVVILKHDSYIRISEGICYSRVWWDEVSLKYLLNDKFRSIRFEVEILLTHVYYYDGKVRYGSGDNIVDIGNWYKYNIIEDIDSKSIIHDAKHKVGSFIPCFIDNYFSIYNEKLLKSKNKQMIKTKIKNMYRRRSSHSNYPEQNIKWRIFNSKLFFQQ